MVTNKEIEAIGLKRLGPKILEDYYVMFYSINKSNHCFVLQQYNTCMCYVYNSDDKCFSFNIRAISDLEVLAKILPEANGFKDKTNFMGGFIPHPNGGFWVNGYMVFFDIKDDNSRKHSGFAVKCGNGEDARAKDIFIDEAKFNSLEELNKIINKW